MKPNYLLPALAALIGFAIAWIAKPSSSPAPVTIKTEEVTPKRPSRAERNTRDSAASRKPPTEVRAKDFPLADLAEQGPKTRDEAKMLRLTEALGLSLDQQGAIIKLIEDTQAKIDGNLPVIEDLNTRGKMIEAGLASLLSPEQLAKFQELRIRERENRTELRAQKMLTSALEDIDISPEQREDILRRLRERSKTELQSIPAAATLLFDKSMLPTGKRELSVDGVLMLAKLNDQVISTDPMEAHNAVINSHRKQLEEMLACFDGILTGGQMGQYQAILYEQQQLLNRAQEHAGIASREQKILATAPVIPAIQPPETEDEPDELEPDPE
jgi:hypothetical protein